MIPQETCKCKDCDRIFNRYIKKDEEEKCPYCGSKKIESIDISF